MFANLTEAVKRRIIGELRSYWAQFPEYRDVLTPNIQGKYAFEERPQMGIVVKGSSATPVSLSPDNFQGTVVSYCHLTKVYPKSGVSIEWVREDTRAIQKNNGVFPSKRGIYYIEVRREEASVNSMVTPALVFYVDPLLDVVDEQPLQFGPFEYEVLAGSFHPGSIRVYLMPGNLPLTPDVDYTADPENGRIHLARAYRNRDYLSVDYRYAAPSSGPFLVPVNGSNNSAIPGVVLAFGNHSEDGDIQAVIVGDLREPSALEYGGRWDISLDMDVLARDTTTQSMISDQTLMFLYTILRPRLAVEGMEISQVNMGGEGEESYDENADDYYYTASLSVNIQTDWSIHVPLDHAIMRVLPNTLASTQVVNTLSDDQIADLVGNPSTVLPVENLNVLAPSDPYFRDRSRDFELIR
jgi:hypothetical protein